MTKRERYSAVISFFEEAMPIAQTELHFESDFHLLVAVALFEAYPTPETMATATVEQVLEYIKSVSYPNSKAHHLIATAQLLVDRFGGVVPQTLEELTSLPGVGRKTANVVMSVAFGQARMAVDTHVFRVSHRLGLVDEQARTPLAVERELVKHFPKSIIPRAHHWLILHGRYVCKAIKPNCISCGLSHACLFYYKKS